MTPNHRAKRLTPKAYHRGPPTPDLMGQRFGKLVVVAKGEPKRCQATWVCQCDCGKSSTPYAYSLRRGVTKSCGCGIGTKTHGMKDAPEFKIWKSMRARCRDINAPSAKYYVLRGIRVCERWDDFENFYADMGPRPSPNLSIDRINNDGNYEPVNCRWATSAQQNANKRNPVRNAAKSLQERK